MNQNQLDQIENFLTSKHREHNNQDVREEEHDRYSQQMGQYQNNDELNIQSRMNDFQSQLQNFEDHSPHKKCVKLTKTKWDKFAPYAFSKLEKQQKIQTFLQLFEQYNNLKKKYNEETDKNRKMGTKIHALQNQFAKIKTISSLTPADRLRVQRQKNQEVTRLKAQIKRLHQKIVALTGNKFNKFSNRPKTANKHSTQKVIQPVNQNIRAELEEQRKHVRQLLIIIDQLKKTKFEVQAQLKDKQANQSNIRNQSRVHSNNLKVQGYNNRTQSQFYQFSNQLQIWKQKYNDLDLIYNQMNEDKDKKIKQLTNQLIQIKQNTRMKQKLERRNAMGGYDANGGNNHYEEKIRNLQDEKQNLQRQLRQLVALPFYQNNKQIIQIQQKLTILQTKYKRTKQQLSKVNETNIKYFSEVEFKNKENQALKSQNIKLKKQIKQNFQKQQHVGGKLVGKNMNNDLEIDYNDYYRKALALVKLEGDDPVWRKFSALAKPEIMSMTEKQVKENAEKLWHDKLQLLAHLEKAQIEINTMKNNMDSRINMYIKDKQYLEEELRVTRARLDEWISMQKINNFGHRDFKVFQQAGIKYDDTISVFDVEEKQLKQLESNQNYFDLYLGHLNLDQTALLKNPDNRIKNMNNFISFLTVDFYNHQTQHSEFSQGVMKKLANNYSFKVEVDTYFLKFLSKNTLTLQLWSPQGTATIMLGKGQIYLSELITKAHKDISNILRGKCQIYHKDRFLIASVQYRIRMRLPIGPYLEWAETKKQFKASLAKDPFAVGKKKNFCLTIQRAEGLPVGINAFVYFSIQNQDFFTEPERGPSPLWDFHREIPVTFDQQFCDQLKQKYFQFTIFDDDKQVNQDVYGIAKVNFTPLADGGDNLDIKADITNNNGDKVGKLKLKVSVISAQY